MQGVGFRPFVYRLAQQFQLTGFVVNASVGVHIEVEGTGANITLFSHALKKTPPAAIIKKISSTPLTPLSDTSFSIRKSHTCLTLFTATKTDDTAKPFTLVPPDLTTCTECYTELLDPLNRRYLYPFINCINCGPRYTIIKQMPYDRATTAMHHFIMCNECLAEYKNPADRRFHAQPNCCHLCGPQLTFIDLNQHIKIKRRKALHAAINLLQQGLTGAIKGLGGFHLVVDATDSQAVSRLRKRKNRPEKPFAVMVKNLHTAQSICQLAAHEQQLLLSPQSPIVLAGKQDNHKLSPLVAPQNDRFGIMLPYTPLHHLLFTLGDFKALIMTSGNAGGEPIAIDNQDAEMRLKSIADFFLLHNRKIYQSNDDSVMQQMAGKIRTIRRSRGYVPQPLTITRDGSSVCGVGGGLKNTVCFLRGREAIISQHVGDLENVAAYNLFIKTINHLKNVFKITPELIAHDLHPDFLSTCWAKEQSDETLLAVQHHHAHMAACLAENHIDQPAIGVIMDGSGYGLDGTVWGGEILIGDCVKFKRYGHFEPMPLPGGDAAVKQPWRAAIGCLAKTFYGCLPDLPFMQEHNWLPVAEIVKKNINSPLTSSCGRLFDAVAAMSGGRQVISYEGQAAILFMQAADSLDDAAPFAFGFTQVNGLLTMLTQPIIRSVVNALQQGTALNEISCRFHRTIIDMLQEAVCRASQETGLKTVALSGGVFQNHILFNGLLKALHKKSFKVVTHSKLPTNDGCISFGQAVIGRGSL